MIQNSWKTNESEQDILNVERTSFAITGIRKQFAIEEASFVATSQTIND